jgi:hypothetical protein
VMTLSAFNAYGSSWHGVAGRWCVCSGWVLSLSMYHTGDAVEDSVFVGKSSARMPFLQREQSTIACGVN